MRKHTIAVLPGDGIGTEVMAAGIRVLRHLESKLDGVQFQLTEYPAGAGEYLKSGNPLPEPVFEACRDADAVLLGAMGLPHVRWSNGREISPQLDLREKLGLYSGFRPIKLYNAVDTPLKGVKAGEIDILIVRENTEGLFSSRLQTVDPLATEVSDILKVTRGGSEQLFQAAFSQAMKRRRKVTLVDKANVLPSMVFFRKIFDEVSGKFPEVETGHIYVDAAALFLVHRPHSFDVLVTENIFGDILSDLGAGIVGGMGMMPAGDVGDNHAVFQPAHGSAPDIAGKGIANPVAMILSVAMMLEWLDTAETRQAASWTDNAVRSVLANPDDRTPDMGGGLSTEDMTKRIISCIQ